MKVKELLYSKVCKRKFILDELDDEEAVFDDHCKCCENHPCKQDIDVSKDALRLIKVIAVCSKKRFSKNDILDLITGKV